MTETESQKPSEKPVKNTLMPTIRTRTWSPPICLSPGFLPLQSIRPLVYSIQGKVVLSNRRFSLEICWTILHVKKQYADPVKGHQTNLLLRSEKLKNPSDRLQRFARDLSVGSFSFHQNCNDAWWFQAVHQSDLSPEIFRVLERYFWSPVEYFSKESRPNIKYRYLQ